ncbi:autophagy-related protein 13 [Dorcoceras hygrometricum]|uniref:Autophagy-related protein 13 n=1 Tax=Dorcoceras hygrometricum TaxID=472368 RepID=A0A2Z7D3N8_9LAMI|nr:autophagy-related protein 13 [Dorcoceras hygrometricum]
MASSNENAPSEPAKMEQIITEFFAKSLHVILESRCPYVSTRNYSGEQILSSPSPSSSSSSSSSSFRPRDKWFNLALRDCPAAFENIDFWQQSNLEPVIVDVVLIKRRGGSEPLSSPKRGGLVRDVDEFGCGKKSEKIIERWVIQYESKKGCGGKGGGVSGSKRSTCTSSHVLYKKSLLLLRSLYATVRLLPAYKLFRDLISSARMRLYNLGHRVSSFVEPFTRGEEADMQQFVFSPVDTSCGRLCLSVAYCSSLMDVSEPSTPISPQFIPEYVGSPMAEPHRWFPSFPESQRSQFTCVFGRHHSWSYDSYSRSHASIPISKRQTSYSKDPSCEEYRTCTDFSLPPNVASQTFVSMQDADASDHQTISTFDKLPFKKDEFRKISDEKPSSNSLLSKLISRTSSSLTFAGGSDDSEFGAFVLDNDAKLGLGSRSGSLDSPLRHEPANNESQVGALVHMLQNAPPLRNKSYFSQQSSNLDGHKNCTQESNKTMADALNELREYGELKGDLLKQSKDSQA